MCLRCPPSPPPTNANLSLLTTCIVGEDGVVVAGKVAGVLQSPETIAKGKHKNDPVVEDGYERGRYVDMFLPNTQGIGKELWQQYVETRNSSTQGFNYLHGNVTHDLNKCSKLTYLDLGNNFFSGAIPNVSSMKGLLYLYVNSSGFLLTFSWKSLENMTELVVLSVGNNPFDKTPFPNEVLKLHKLYWLYMSNCSIEGEIPAGIGGLTELVNLEISDNYITGEIPNEISWLNKLWQLGLYNNNLSGKLSVRLRTLTKLEFFDASNNDLEGDLSDVRFLNHLKRLQLYENDFSGDIAPEIGEFKQLNQLTGRLPQNLGSWSDFIFIDVSENYLTGPIPPDMCKNGKMTQLLMPQNNLLDRGNGLKSTFRSDPDLSSLSLRLFDLSHNRLVGAISEPLSNGSFVGNPGLCSKKGYGEAHHLILKRVMSHSCLARMLLNKSQKDDQSRLLKDYLWNVKSFYRLTFTKDDIIDAIKEENMIVRGRSGEVYRVSLENGVDVAVKHIRNTCSLEFAAEEEILSSIRHDNVVSLYCSITSEHSSLLVYEYFPNGNLSGLLHSSFGLDWKTRYEIAIGVAKALEYLHHDHVARPVIHRDVKLPRLVDFGLAKVVRNDTPNGSTHVIVGTQGYMAP
ncbi:LOW QUALITY PROTEIN: hypothetical protein OSB04_002240, partial [Centaurea solstitialis]